MTLYTATKSSRIINATPFFYGWVILFAGTMGSVMMGASQTFTVSIFLDKFITDLDISRSNISLMYGLATLVASFSLPYTGKLIDRYGPRRMMLIIMTSLGLAIMSLSLVQGMLTIFLGLTATRFLGFGSTQLVSNNVIAQWFIRRRGFVMGLSGLSLPISLAIFPRLSEWLIIQFGWRMAWIWFGVTIWLIMIPLILIFIKDRPEQYGLLPDGDGATDMENLPSSLVNEENWTLPQARQTPIFWLFLAALSTLTATLAGVVFHQISLFEARGLSREMAISAFQAMALFAVVGNLLMGRLLDRFSARYLLSATLTMLASVVILIQIMTSPMHAFFLGVLMGLTSGMFRVIDSTIWAKYFGRLHLGSIKGAAMISIIGCTALGPYILGLSFDYLDSYNPALLALLVLPILIGLIAPFVPRPEKLSSQSS